MASPSAMTSSRAACVLLLSAALLLQAVAVTGQATVAQQIVQKFTEVTTLSNQLRIDTQKITLITAPLRGQIIAQGFAGIIQSVSGGVTMLSAPNMVALSDADAQTVVAALTTFVQVHQALLNVVIGKHGLLTLIPFFEPIRESLVSLEGTVDSFAFYLIAIIPTQKPAANQQFGALTVTVQQAIDTYEQPLQ